MIRFIDNTNAARALSWAQCITESASDADENVFRFELAIFHEANMAKRPTQVYANLQGTQNEKVLRIGRGKPNP
jgi:hypothetical protein